jgi:hypothetical protein
MAKRRPRASQGITGGAQMPLWLTILIIVAAYIFIIFFLSHMILPYYSWKKKPLPRYISDQIQKEIDSLRATYPNQGMFLRAAYELVAKRYNVKVISTLLHIPTLFIHSPEKLWNMKNRFIACHQLNLMLRIFLVRSKLFTEDEVRVKYTVMNINTHQYLQVKAEDNWINIDVWGKKYNIPFGTYGHGVVAKF